MIKLRVFDDGGKTFERYTVVIDQDIYEMTETGDNYYYVGRISKISEDPTQTRNEVKNIQGLPDKVKLSLTMIVCNKAYSLSIFEQCKLLEIETDHHESDLYVKATRESKFIIEEYKFKNSVIEFHTDNDWWYEIPFGFDPFWDKKSNIK